MPESVSMGRQLAHAHANRGKILFHTAVRFLLAGVVVLAGIRGNPPKGGPVNFLAGLLAALETLGNISFMDVRSNFSMFERTYMCTEARRFNVTYIKDAKKNYNRAYFNEI